MGAKDIGDSQVIILSNTLNTSTPQTATPFSRRILGYFGLAGIFFALSFASLYVVHHYFSTGKIQIPETLLSAPVITSLIILLIVYFLADGLRLYAVIRAMGYRIPFLYIMKLVFINIFVSSVTPLATGGGVVQVYFMKRQGMPIGEATAATSIRTILAALILFALTPVIIWINPKMTQMFSHGNLLYGITLFSGLYLTVFWIILFRIRLLKRWILYVLLFFKRTRIISQSRCRRYYLRVSQETGRFSDGFKRYFSGNPQWALLSVVMTAVFLLLLFSFSVVLIKALGYEITTITILAFQVVVTFFMYFAPTPGATGVAEGGYGLLFAQIVHKQDITILTLSWRFLTIYVGVAIGILVIYREFFGHKKKTHHAD